MDTRAQARMVPVMDSVRELGQVTAFLNRRVPGASLLTVNAAVYLAWQVRSSGKRVLLVDAHHPCSPALARQLGSAPVTVNDLLNGHPSPAATETHLPRRPELNLSVLSAAPADARRPTPAEYCEVVEKLRTRFDHILVDVPPQAVGQDLLSGWLWSGADGFVVNAAEDEIRTEHWARELADLTGRLDRARRAKVSVAVHGTAAAAARIGSVPHVPVTVPAAPVVAAGEPLPVATRNDTALNTACFTLLRSALDEPVLREPNPAPLRRAAREVLLLQLRRRPRQ